MPLTIVCVLKTGGDYEARHVEALRKAFGLREVLCLTDDEDVAEPKQPLLYDLPGWWSKMEAYRTDSLKGDILLVDLDTMIPGKLASIISRCEGHQPILLQDFYRPGGLQSSLVFMPEEARQQTWDRFIIQSDAVMARFERGGDQQFLETMWLQYALRWQDILPGQIVSYKNDCAGGVPEDARVVIFHGLPRPWDTELWHG